MEKFKKAVGRSLCPYCGEEIEVETNIITEGGIKMEVTNLGVLMMLKCKSCKTEFPYFRNVKDVSVFNKAIKTSLNNQAKNLNSSKGVGVAMNMLNSFNLDEIYNLGKVLNRNKIELEFEKGETPPGILNEVENMLSFKFAADDWEFFNKNQSALKKDVKITIYLEELFRKI